MRAVLSLLTPHFRVVYVHYEGKAFADDQPYEALGDKPMVRREFPDVTLIEDLTSALEGDFDYNLLLYGLASQCAHFVSVQGGTSIIASMFGGTNLVFASKGGEVEQVPSEYTKWYGRLGGAKVRHTNDRGELVRWVRSSFVPSVAPPVRRRHMMRL